MESKGTTNQIEEIQSQSSQNDLAKVDTMGTVRLTEGEIVYIPTPTADPQGELSSNTATITPLKWFKIP